MEERGQNKQAGAVWVVRKATKRSGEKASESTSQAFVTLLTVVLFGLGWAHVELDRGRDAAPQENRYAQARTIPVAGPLAGHFEGRKDTDRSTAGPSELAPEPKEGMPR